MKVKLFIIVTMAFLLFIPAGFLSAQYDFFLFQQDFYLLNMIHMILMSCKLKWMQL